MFLRVVDELRRVFRRDEGSEESSHIKQAIENIAQLLIGGNYDCVANSLIKTSEVIF